MSKWYYKTASSFKAKNLTTTKIQHEIERFSLLIPICDWYTIEHKNQMTKCAGEEKKQIGQIKTRITFSPGIP